MKNSCIGHNHMSIPKVVSLKANHFVRRLFQNRIPTTNNLIRRDVLQNNAQLCVEGCGSYETVNLYVFEMCFQPERPPKHFLQFGHFHGVSKNYKSSVYLLWIYCVWITWKERTNRLFQQKEQINSVYLITLNFSIFGG